MKEMSSSGREILNALKRSESGLTIEQLSAGLGVTLMAVHRPLMVLENRGYVQSELQREAKRGRPVRVYRLTDLADELFPKNYGGFFIEFVRELGFRDGMQRVRQLFQARFKRSAQKHRDRMKGKDLSARVQTLSQILNENHYMAEQKQTGPNRYVIKLLNCPISKVAKEFPEACSCEKQFVSELVEAPVVRDHHILAGHNYCSYVITKK